MKDAALSGKLKINAIPDFFLIDKQGIIRGKGGYLSARNPKVHKKIKKVDERVIYISRKDKLGFSLERESNKVKYPIQIGKFI